MDTSLESLLGFGINLVIVFAIVRFIYYPRRRDKDYVFTFFAFNTIIFFVMGLLNNAELSVGVGFGLFAIFSALRYRTMTIPIREMTYLFIFTALPVLNSILLGKGSYTEFAVVNLAVMGVLFVLELGWGFQYESHKTITYERIDLIRPENWPKLVEDLQARTGLVIKRIEIGRVNFLRDTAEIVIYYDAQTVDTALVRLVGNHTVVDEDDGFDS